MIPIGLAGRGINVFFDQGQISNARICDQAIEVCLKPNLGKMTAVG